MKKRKKIWTGKWIEPIQIPVTDEPPFNLKDMFAGKIIPQTPQEERLHPCQLMKRTFRIKDVKNIVQAKLTMTAHGIYKVKINGQEVTEALFTPDNTSYKKYLQYQEYNVTSFLNQENIWSVIVADGWYAGRISVDGSSAQFGNMLGILGELEIAYADGSFEIIGTDQNFVSKTGKYVYSDIFIGEKQDLRLEDNWETDFSIDGMTPVKVVEYPMDNLVPQRGEYVKAQEVFEPIDIWREGDAWIIDFGQVIAGYVCLELELAVNQEIVLEHSETLNEKGEYFNNILGRNKDQKDIFIGRGRHEILKPEFTFHGFRYVRLSGFLGDLKKENLTAVAVYTDMKKTGSFITDHPKINQLLSNIEWSQKGNMISIPTDCPQRERVGWTGDMQVYAPTATFFMDVSELISRWLDQVRADQLENGEVVEYSPLPGKHLNQVPMTGSFSSAGWGDAIIMVPWTLYERYGNKRILEENYEAMLKWYEFSIESAAGEKSGWEKYLWDTKFHFGDWMFPSYMIGSNPKGPMATAHETKEIFGTAFLANSSFLLSKIAGILGYSDQSAQFHSYGKKVKEAFEKAYFKDGRLLRDFQGCYVIALAFDLLTEPAKKAAVKRLIQLIQANGNRLDTGFLSIPYLLDVLVANDYEDLAREIFLNEQCPSWLYEVNKGATTIWESWAGIQPDGTVGKHSFNHYAFGCVGDWMVRNIAGLQVKKPGFSEIYIRPNLNLGISCFDLCYDSVKGPICISVNNSQLKVIIPPGVTAIVEQPDLGITKKIIQQDGQTVFDFKI